MPVLGRIYIYSGLLLIMIAANTQWAGAQAYSRCLVYKTGGADTTRRILQSITYYSADGKQVSSKTFCGNVDTSCYLNYTLNFYDAEKRLVDSLFIKENGDTQRTRITYDAKGGRSKAATLISEHKKTATGADSMAYRLETIYYYYDKKGRLLSSVDRRSEGTRVYYLTRSYYFYDKQGRQTVDSAVAAFCPYEPGVTPDTCKWQFSYKMVRTYTADGYESNGYYGEENRNDTHSTVTYKKDKQGRIIQETKDLGGIIFVTTYGYFPDQRITLVAYKSDVFPGMGGITALIHVYE